MSPSPPFLFGLKPRVLQAWVLVGAILWTYFPAIHGGWLWDDDLLIVGNFHLRSLGGLWDTWFKPGDQVDYYPLEQTVLWGEWHLWQFNTLGYHLVTMALHVVNAFLVWRLFDKLGLRLAWLGALLFAIHPVQVESVAWIAELKNTLSLAPFVLAMMVWIDYDRAGKRADYFWALGLFLVATLCKMTVVMFPVVILLYAWWKRGRIGWGDLRVSVPFFAVALALGSIIILSGNWERRFHHDGPAYLPDGGVAGRLLLMGQEIAFYFSKSILPMGLLPIYPKWPVNLSSPVQYLPWVVLVLVAGACWMKRNSWGRSALFGLGFFVINLAPCPGFIPRPDMGYAWVMDHFLYLPIIGLIGLAMAGLAQVEKQLTPSLRLAGMAVAVLIVAVLICGSRAYAGIYLSQETLWSFTLRGNPDSDVARNNLGLAYLNSNRWPQAIDQFEAALKITPGYVFAHNGLANALFFSGRVPEAIEHYRAAVKLDPDYAEAHNGLGNALLQAGHEDEAEPEFQKALKLNPDNADVHCNLGLLLAKQGNISGAIEQFEIAERLTPADKRIPPILDSLRAQMQNPTPQK